MVNKIDIYKAGGVIIRDKKFLVTRSAGKDFFIAPGGKLEGDETATQALVREILEEVQLVIDESSLESIGSFIAKAAGQEHKTLQMDVFIIHNYEGTPIPSNEVEEIRWINTQTAGVKIGSIFEHEVMPLLEKRGLID